MANVQYEMLAAICRGDFTRVKEYVDTYDLMHSPQWEDGYVLLQNSTQRKHTEISKYLLSKGSKVNSSSSSANTPLHYAVKNGEMDIVQMLLDKGAELNMIDNTGCTPLYYAIASKNLPMCKLLFQHGASLEIFHSKQTPLSIAVLTKSADIVDLVLKQDSVNSALKDKSILHQAVTSDNEKIVNLILGRGPDVDWTDIKGRSPVHIGVERKNIKILEILLKHGASVNLLDQQGRMPIHVAAQKGQYRIIEILLKHGSPVNPKVTCGPEEGLTPIFLAVIKGCKKSIRLLLKRGVNINTSAKNNEMPIHAAAQRGYTDIIKLLLSHGATVDPIITSGDEKGYTPLHLAVTNSSKESSVTALLNAGANINHENSQGFSALSIAVYNKDQHMFEELLKFRPDIHNSGNRKALYIAVGSNDVYYKPMVDKLVEFGFNMNSEDINDKKFIESAVRNNYLHIVKQLLQCGADPNSPSNNLRTAVQHVHTEMATLLIENGATDSVDLLHVAIKTENMKKQLVELLLRHGAELNYEDENGRTALFFCVSRDENFSPQCRGEIDDGKIELAKVLVEFGANLNKVDKNGQTVLHMAAKTRNLKIINEFQLMNREIDVDIVDTYGYSVLSTAVLTKDLQIIEKILEFNPDINCKNNRKSLKIAICYKDKDHQDKQIVDTLVQYGFVVDSEDIHDKELMSSAINNNYTFIVNYLLEHGANVNFGGLESSPLYIAVENGQTEIAKLLIEHGAIVSHGLLPLAIEKGNKEILELLFHHGVDPKVVDENGRTVLHSCLYSTINSEAKVEIIKLLCLVGVNINHEDGNCFTPLKIAVKNREVKSISELLSYNPDINQRSNRESLHIAICDDPHDAKEIIVNILLNYGFVVHSEDASDSKLMHYAIKHNHFPVVSQLLQFGANPSSSYDPESNGKMLSHLYVAVDNDYDQIIELLFEYKVQVEESMLHLAIERGNNALVELLLERGTDPNCIDEYGKTALHCCVLSTPKHKAVSTITTWVSPTPRPPSLKSDSLHNRSGLKIVQLLLKFGANIDDVDNHGRTVLNYAVDKQDLDLTRELLKYKPSLNNAANKESLHIAINHSNHEILSILLDYGFTLNSEDVNDGKIILAAIRYNHFAIVNQLLELGSDPNSFYEGQSGIKTTMLSAAVLFGHSEITELLIKHGAQVKSYHLLLNVEKENKTIVELLLNHGADPNVVDEDGVTALHCFVSNCRNPLSTDENYKLREEIVKLLLKKGACVNACNKLGNTPLHETSKSGTRRPNVHLAEILIENGAAIEMKNKRRETPLHVAVITHNREMIDVLLEHGANMYTQSGFGKTLFQHASPDIITKLLNFDFNNENHSQIIVSIVMYYLTPYLHGEYYDEDVDYLDSDWCSFRFRCLQDFTIMAEEMGYHLQDKHPVLPKIRYFKKRTTFIGQCEEEVKHMKQQMIAESKVSYYDFLRKTNHQLAVCLKNESIASSLEGGEYNVLFPIYSRAIHGSFSRGKFRKQLLAKVMDKCHHLFPHLPPECAQLFLSYLNNEELRVLTTL